MDQVLWQREAFEALLQPHLPALWRFIRRLVRDTHEAEDLVQEACLKAFKAVHRLQPGTDARAWLFTILINTYRDWVRTVLRQPTMLELDDLSVLYQQDDSPYAPSLAPTPEQTAMHAELGRLVRVALDDLPPEFRMTVFLADVEGYSYKEIATMMACPLGTVMSRLSRARHLLRTTLQATLQG
ncbi:MAG: sigma-70 family RNA polymerase sigma factor [Candidatus Tectomicrobia bacterium]|uniref:RNA polymerase sigma factor n=1 Tax=Tectimicrobiota bacterium TaxID=2528274 RepID=A0A937W3R9_UNCTE|nr:sigma-70 family RNA polymerase sigma factor [Candidatus Tectomicrobia bacterium]